MNILLSQGMTRPGIVQDQHWGPSIVEAERIAALSRNSWMPVPIGTRLTPPSYADPRLSNRMER